MYKLSKGVSGICESTDQKDPKFKVIDLKKATQEQLEFLFKRGVAGIEKEKAKK